MLMRLLRPLFHSFAASMPCRRLTCSCCTYTACLVYAACLVGTVEAQQLRTGSSPRFDPKLNSLAQSPSASAVANYPLAQTFLLHSRPSATKRIYLDFDGHVTTGTGWNTANSAWPTDTPVITTAPWSLDGFASFTSAELLFIQEVFDRVAECFSPFDVDVTTEAPLVADLLNTGAGDTRWGVRVCIGNVTPSSPGGGWGFIGAFGVNSVSGNDTPCFVFNLNPAKVTADTCVHEAGHTLGLNHDGRNSPRETYYFGHGFGPTGWAPHMGAAYNQNLAQWSKGEYLSADNQEDDLNIIATRPGNGFGYRPDDYANSSGAAGVISGTVAAGVFNVDQSGVIEQRTDADWFKITTAAGTLNLIATGGPANTMLDIQMDLYSAGGSLLVSSNPITNVTASISRTVTAGTYYIKIDGVGNGDPLATGYTDYSSLGQFRITGTYPAAPPPPPTVASIVTANYNAGTKTLTLVGDNRENVITVTVTGRKVTIQGALGTKITDLNTGKSNLVSTSYVHTGPLVLNANLNDGNDAISVVGVNSSTTDIKLGAGNDKAALTLCKIGTLIIDGGLGLDTLITTSSTITTKTVTGVP